MNFGAHPVIDRTFLSWPFFEPRHRELADRLRRFGERAEGHSNDIDQQCRKLVAALCGSRPPMLALRHRRA